VLFRSGTLPPRRAQVADTMQIQQEQQHQQQQQQQQEEQQLGQQQSQVALPGSNFLVRDLPDFDFAASCMPEQAGFGAPCTIEVLGKGACDELTDALQGREAPHTKGKQSKFGEETMHDAKAAQVGEVLRNYLAASSDKERGCTLDQLLPPSATDKAIAAMTFHAILTLATAGHVQVEQHEPFSPVRIFAA